MVKLSNWNPLLETLNDSLLIYSGPPSNLEVMAERIRIDAFLKERGFYFFSPEYLLIKADSTAGDHQVDGAGISQQLHWGLLRITIAVMVTDDRLYPRRCEG